MGIPLDDMSKANGGLAFVPGSHRGPTYDHHTDDGLFRGIICDAAFDARGAVTPDVPAGAITLHHVRAVHGSAANRSARDRRLYLVQYAACDAWPLMSTDWNSWGVPADGRTPWQVYCGTILRGTPCSTPRLEPAPVRMCYPNPQDVDGSEYGSIYVQQELAVARNGQLTGRVH